MPSNRDLQISLLAMLLAAFAGCAAGSFTHQKHRGEQRAADLRCPAGHTLTCEANRIGRIFQGTFANSTDKCACMPDNGRTLDSPVIPAVRQ